MSLSWVSGSWRGYGVDRAQLTLGLTIGTAAGRSHWGEPDSADWARILTMPPRGFRGVHLGECLGSLGESPARPTGCSPRTSSHAATHPERLLHVRRAGHRAYGAGRCSQASAGRAVVPITVGLGETQSYQVSVPIKLPCRAAGTKVTALNFFLSNEDGDPCDLLQDRFEAVVVVEWSI
jgi:hypothetical protein